MTNDKGLMTKHLYAYESNGSTVGDGIGLAAAQLGARRGSGGAF